MKIPKNNQSIRLTALFEGEKVSLLSEGYINYLSVADEKEAARYLFANSNNAFDYSNDFFDYSKDVELKWERVDGIRTAEYIVHLSTNLDFANEQTINAGPATAVKLTNLIPNQTYYWKVTDSSNVESTIGYFQTKNEIVRRISVEGVYNMRDLGGWPTQFGGKVKYGMVYRSGMLDGITAIGKETFFNRLNIKTEIDLRHEFSQSVLETDIHFVHAGILQNGFIFPEFIQTRPIERAFDLKTPSGIKTAFEALANIDNYPLVFHCSGGADRTGTLSFLLNGLLGVSYENLIKDFELTSFSRYGKRWRSNIIKKDDTFSFDESGVMEDLSNHIAFGKMYNMMIQYYGTETRDLAAACENYLRSVCLVSQEVIDKVRGILIER